ncbi:hypothetical protein SLEP1_g30516 [Rubroshorea leprosula]|uniref:PHD-type domain-containing protein n=1 Tax=Rubroshorea leprosula TaxID=152421 RepID=A0AAV5K2Q9_9ROSI|nr:hypothetical protein SLEP1_g30516 [Rubroshorea leprosula]
MCPKCNDRPQRDCTEAVSVSNKKETHYSCTLDFQRTCQQSVVSTMSENPVPTFVYSRRKDKGNSAAALSTMSEIPVPTFVYSRRKEKGNSAAAVSTLSENPVPTFVYSRRKKKGNSAGTFSAADVPENSKRSDCLSVVSSDVLSITANEIHGALLVEPETEGVGPSGMPPLHTGQPFLLKTVLNEGCLVVEDQGSDNVLKTLQKTVEVDSIHDSCSSSKSNIELALDSLKGEIDDNGDCSSSTIALEFRRDGLSERDICISMLRCAELLQPSGTALVGDIGTGSGSSYTRACKICACQESAPNMLICDNCENAFHVPCCNPPIKEIPEDEWLCHSCLRKKQKFLKETDGSCREVKNNLISLMLRDGEPYKSSVAVGKGFQAEVPEWSGPINNSDVDRIGEPLEIDSSDYSNLHDLNHIMLPKSNSIGNWLQCRAVIEGIGKDVDGTICGKWHRAPLYEEQTDDWDCFSAIFWDPYHADCAAPQELETDQVLKQLKYVEAMRSQISVKRQKLSHGKNHT